MPFVALMLSVLVQANAADRSPPKETAMATVDEHATTLIDASERIWDWAELALVEHRSAKLLADLAESQGFRVSRGISGMETAFVAEYGSGKPVLAFLAEYDALPSLSQGVSPRQERRDDNENGHGCGHNLFGAASTGAALAVKRAMEEHGLPGTVRLYGTPAEEQGIGKVFMVRDGLFDDVDACLSWHPSNQNEVRLQPSKALRSFEITFYGRSAHAAGSPWDGVSALDGLEAFLSGVNLLREHIPESARIHYVITDGGAAPNVVPSRARVWMFTRGKDWREQERVYQHVRGIVEGADRMAWGEEYGAEDRGFQPAHVHDFTGLYEYNTNEPLARVVHENLSLVGGPRFTAEEQEFGKALQRNFGFPALGFSEDVVPFNPRAAPEPGGSTDVANISWVAPTIDLSVATWPIACPAHSWASTSASGSSAAMKAMLTAAKTLACAGVQLTTDDDAVVRIRAAFERSREHFDYLPPIGPDAVPALPSHMVGN